jgi:hypothetical protein
MSKDWLENIASHLPASLEHAVKEADKAIHDYKEHVHFSHWHPISTAPHNQELELRIPEDGTVVALKFPCQLTNAGAWINVDLGSEIKIEPVEWRRWQREKSPDPHHAKIKASDRSAVFHQRPPVERKD